jgi:hypothetical protein
VPPRHELSVYDSPVPIEWIPTPVAHPHLTVPALEFSSSIEKLEARYTTKWRGAATMEEVLTDPQVRKTAFAKARSIGYIDQDAEDCFQLGSFNLWQSLQEQPELLCDKGAAWVGIWIAFSGSRRSLWKHRERNISLDQQNDNTPLDVSPMFHPHRRPERWAGWATRVDQQIDFAILMTTLANRYQDDQLKLFALYALTTSVKMKDVAAVAGIDKKRFTQVVGNQVKDDIRSLLRDEEEAGSTKTDWMQELKQGKRLECVTGVAEKVMDNQRLLLALYIVTTSATRKDVTELFRIGLTAFRKEITQIKVMLSEEYHKARNQ